MLRSIVPAVGILFALESAAFAQARVVAADALDPAAQQKAFQLPPGFAIQLVAAEPKIKKPINIAFDFQGRLWVTGSEEYPFAAPAARPGKDTVKILSDIGEDGLARTVTTYADGLNIPIGVLPLPEGALVYSIPSVYFMPEKDGVAAGKDVRYSQYGFKDTHGMTGEFLWGFDGWIYCCHGFANTSTVKGKGPDVLTMTSGNTYRMKADGSRLESFTRGQVNPFGLCTDPYGNIFSSDCHTRPLYQLLKGATYPSFGRTHDGLGFGPEMVTHDHGSSGIGGIAVTADDRFPVEFQNNFFVGNVVTNRVNRDRIDKHGSTLEGIAMPDFVTTTDQWFRPVDIKLGPDGALYVADFYNRIIGHYEVDLKHPGRDREKGRIWRIVALDESGKPKLHPVKNLLKASTDELIDSLGHPNLTVRLQATHVLVHRADAAATPKLIEAVRTGSPTKKAHALWALERTGKLDDAALGQALRDESPLVRTHGQRILAERPSWKGDHRTWAIAGLADASGDVQRAAAQGLGAHPHTSQVEPLLKLRREAPQQDTHLIHVARMALRDHFEDADVGASIAGRTWEDSQTLALADVTPGARGGAGARFLARAFQKELGAGALKKEYIQVIIKQGSAEDRGVVGQLVRDRFASNPAEQAKLLRAMQQAYQERGERLGPVETKLAEDIIPGLLASKFINQMQDAIDLANELKAPSTLGPLLDAVRITKGYPKLRAAAIGAVTAIDPEKSLPTLSAVLVNEKEDLDVREQIARALAGTNRPSSHEILIRAMAAAPGPLQSTIATGMAGSARGAETLLQAIEAGKASPRLLQDRGLVVRMQQTKLPELDARIAKLTRGLPAADEKLTQLLRDRKAEFAKGTWDSKQGHAVFVKHCAACHQISNEGAKIGPQLDGIGVRGLERVLEDVLDPHRNVDQAFRSTTLELKDGRVLSGLLLREEGAVLVMADNQGKEVRVPNADVENRTVSSLSPMPSNFWEQVPPDDFHRLMSFLLAQRPKN